MNLRNIEGETLTQLVLEIFRINGEFLGAGNKLAKPFGLTSARWQILGAIDEAQSALTVSQIARRMGLARQGVQRIANDLEKFGLIGAKDNIDHKRAPLFFLTEEGKRIVGEVNRAQAQWVNELASGVSKQELKKALDLLGTLREKSEKLSREMEKKGSQ